MQAGAGRYAGRDGCEPRRLCAERDRRAEYGDSRRGADGRPRGIHADRAQLRAAPAFGAGQKRRDYADARTAGCGRADGRAGDRARADRADAAGRDDAHLQRAGAGAGRCGGRRGVPSARRSLSGGRGADGGSSAAGAEKMGLHHAGHAGAQGAARPARHGRALGRGRGDARAASAGRNGFGLRKHVSAQNNARQSGERDAQSAGHCGAICRDAVCAGASAGPHCPTRP